VLFSSGLRAVVEKSKENNKKLTLLTFARNSDDFSTLADVANEDFDEFETNSEATDCVNPSDLGRCAAPGRQDGVRTKKTVPSQRAQWSLQIRPN